MLLIKLLALHLLGRVCVENYNIYRSSCRKYAVFKATDRGKKVNGGLIGAYIVGSLPECLRRCLASGSCLTFNFSPPSNQNNCEILTSSRVNGGTLEAATNWNHYEPISQQVRKLFHDSRLFTCWIFICQLVHPFDNFSTPLFSHTSYPLQIPGFRVKGVR